MHKRVGPFFAEVGFEEAHGRVLEGAVHVVLLLPLLDGGHASRGIIGSAFSCEGYVLLQVVFEGWKNDRINEGFVLKSTEKHVLREE